MLVKYSSKWLPYLREISDNAFTYPTLKWQDIEKYAIKMHFADDPVTDTLAKPTGFYAVKSMPAAIMILKLSVHPLYQGQGYGTELLAGIELDALDSGRKLVTINVHEMNLCTIYWLQKRGYIAVRLEHALYVDGRDGYSFYKEIK